MTFLTANEFAALTTSAPRENVQPSAASLMLAGMSTLPTVAEHAMQCVTGPVPLMYHDLLEVTPDPVSARLRRRYLARTGA